MVFAHIQNTHVHTSPHLPLFSFSPTTNKQLEEEATELDIEPPAPAPPSSSASATGNSSSNDPNAAPIKFEHRMRFRPLEIGAC